MTSEYVKKEVNINERGNYVDTSIYCQDNDCQFVLGPIEDMVLRRTATFNVNKQDIEKLLVDVIVVTAKMLVKYQEADQQHIKQDYEEIP